MIPLMLNVHHGIVDANKEPFEFIDLAIILQGLYFFYSKFPRL